jgi:hypothetical protein
VKPKFATVDFTVRGSFYPTGHHMKAGERMKKRAEVFKRLKGKRPEKPVVSGGGSA